MHPNEHFIYGFIGKNERLTEIIDTDREQIQRLGVSYDAIASAIEDLFLSDAEKYNGNPVFRKEFIHSPVCPWEDYCTVSLFDLTKKVTEIIVVNGQKFDEAREVEKKYGRLTLASYPEFVQRDLIMVFSDLHPHIIREHNFFEGHVTPYRVEPERAVRYLGIPPLGGE